MDNLKRTLIFIFSGGALAYLGTLFTQDAVIIATGIEAKWNFMLYGIIAAIFLYILVFYVLMPKPIKRGKVILVAMGLALLLIGNQALTNNVETGLFVGDIITVLGVVLTLVAPTNLMILKKVKKQKEEAEIEVIEV